MAESAQFVGGLLLPEAPPHQLDADRAWIPGGAPAPPDPTLQEPVAPLELVLPGGGARKGLALFGGAGGRFWRMLGRKRTPKCCLVLRD